MTDARELHDKAMQEVDRAESLNMAGSQESSRLHLQKAFAFERQAADLFAAPESPEPTRAVLHRSAATLAFRCGDLDAAERLIHRALYATPPAFVAEELKDLLEQVTFKRHLEIRGVEISENELQISLAGRGVGFGFAPADGVLDRLNSFSAMLFRTAERTLDIAYRESGPHSIKIHNLVDSYISVPRAASFAVTVRLGNSNQLSLAGLGTSEQIVDEALNCLDLFETGDEAELRKRIEDESYFNNFVGLARNLAPDGTIVQTVGFTTIRNGVERRTALRRTRLDTLEAGLALVSKGKAISSAGKLPESITLQGVLQYANSLRGKHELKIKGTDEPITTVHVPTGLLDDIVRPLWGREVAIRGLKKGRRIILEDIQPYFPEII